MKKSLLGVVIGAFVCVSLWQVMLIAKPTAENEKSHQLQKQAHEIQSAFEARIKSLDTILKVILKAEQKNKSKTEYLTNSGYEHFYNKFKEKNENMHEIAKSRNKIMRHFIDTAKEVANTYSVADEFVAFEAGVSYIVGAFLSQVAHTKTKLDKHEFGKNLQSKSSAKDFATSSPHAKTQQEKATNPKSNTATDAQKQSLYQEKIGYILAEFENEYMGLVSDAYSEFSDKVKAHFGKNKMAK